MILLGQLLQFHWNTSFKNRIDTNVMFKMLVITDNCCFLRKVEK